MTSQPLLVFDFDGVIVDGMAEYWWSAWMAAQRLNAEPQGLGSDAVPQGFRRLRPWVHHGWEMVLLAAEMPQLDPERWVVDYATEQDMALQRRGWSASLLQEALDQTRQQAVSSDRAAWLGLHQPFPGLVDRLQAFQEEGVDWAVLTTKTAAFTAELLESLGLRPWQLDGREAGPKPEVLLRLQRERVLAGFVEDRRATLETVRDTDGLQSLPCWLASWGYLKPSDREDLPRGIQLIDQDRLATPLAQWP
ncbi:haloacid dehalogenase-like hydrolase family protein [Synechococcus sp. A18-46.1]|nr:haloacid dehalogenase-like hydrolase family protein [Synechococcus sp. A18-46.1]